MKTSSNEGATGLRWERGTPAAAKRFGRRSRGPSAERTRKCRYSPKVCTSSIRIFDGDLAGSHVLVRGQLQDPAGQAVHQVTRRALRQGAAVVHEEDPVETHGFVHVRGAHQHGRACPQQTYQQMPELLPGNRVNPSGWLVQKEDLRTMDEGRRQPQFFLHTS